MTVPVFCRKLFGHHKVKKTIYQCFNPVLQISALGGICSVTEYKNSYILSYGLVGFQIFIILLNALQIFLTCNDFMHSTTTESSSAIMQNETELVLPTSDFITGIAQPLIVSLSTLILRVLNLVLLHKNLPKIFKIMEIAKRAVDFKDINCKDYSYAKFLITSVLLLSVPYQIFSLVDDINNDPYNTTKFIVLTFNHYNNFSALCLDMQFSYVCYILKNRFQIDNEHLRKNSMTEAFVEPKSKSISILSYSSNNQLKSVLDLRDCYHKLCECCEHLNKLYNVQLLITLTNCFVNVLLNLYFAIFGGFGTVPGRQDRSELVWDMFKQIIWGFYYFIRFADVCAMAESLSKEANLSKVLICDFIANCNDEDMKDALWTFHAYTVSSDVKFTAWGFFKIDLSLISSAIAAGTTYLVILAQFHGQQEYSGCKIRKC